MDRHITDKPRTRSETSRLREYLRVERNEGRSPVFDMLHRKPHGSSDRKVVEYVRIERGQTA
jgi:hypothetical protein